VVEVSSWIEISKERLAGNFRVIAEAAGAETDVLAVVKANAYGHGAEICAVALARAGAKWFAVANVNEGQRVRRALEAAGFAASMLVMCGFLPEDAAAIGAHDLTPVVWTREQVEWLAGTGMRVHIEIETGMGRQGVSAGADLAFLLDAIVNAGLELDGVCTHFCAAEAADGGLTRAQQKRFAEAVAQVKDKGLRPQWVHAGSTSSVDNPAQAEPCLVELAKELGARAMVRCGIGLYGYCLPIDGATRQNPKIRETLKPVMTWKTRVMDVREVAAGETVGYNASFTAPGPMRLALLAAGYADGLRRSLSSTNAKQGGWVRVAGRDGELKCAPIVGRVSMNLTMVDVSGIDGVRVGDEVVLLGDGVTADDHALLAGTISYEILCGVRAE
jgi:alanine racemase